MDFQETWFPSTDGVTLEAWFISSDSDKLLIINHPMTCMASQVICPNTKPITAG